MGFIGDIGHFIITPLYYLVSAVLVGWHKVFGTIFGTDSGASWVLAIVFLTVTIRVALIPLFVKQINSSRNMQLLQPKVKELQKKFGHDRERLTQETMALYKETGTNPFSSCLPLLIQMPIFLALFRLLSHAAKTKSRDSAKSIGLLSKNDAYSFAHAHLFGGEISSSFVHDGGSVQIKVIAGFLVLAMTLTTFLTQRQLMSKNMPADALSGPYAQQQKMLLYVLPLVFAVGGIAFPIGVIMYWTTSNLWTMGQQFYVIRNNPAPNTEAARAKQVRDDAKAAAKGLPAGSGSTAVVVEAEVEDKRPATRQQPKKQSRQQRRTQAPKNSSPSGDSKGESE